MKSMSMKGSACSTDPHFYQACDTRIPDYLITNSEILCKNYLCKPTDILSGAPEANLFTPTGKKKAHNELPSFVCNGYRDCLNTDLDEMGCDLVNITTLRTGLTIDSRQKCDGKCDTLKCEDEAECNGFTYGLYCKNSDPEELFEEYIALANICY